jgi:hypothetical protein
LLLFALVACRSTQPAAPLGEEEEQPPPRLKMYFHGDAKAAMERVRKNAVCKLEERSNGIKIFCGDADLWLVPEDSGVEITCTGLPANCRRRVEALLK